MKRTEREAEETKKSILKAAVRIFSKKGYAAARLEDIAREAGVTRGAVYHHFHNKAGVMLSLVELYVGEIDRMAELGAVSSGDNLRELLEKIFITPLQRIESDKYFAAFMEFVLIRGGEYPEIINVRQTRRELVQQQIRQISAVLEEAVRTGKGRKDLNPERTARLIISLQHGLLAAWLELEKTYSITQTATDAMDVVLRGIT